jgi:hypothetical protein
MSRLYVVLSCLVFGLLLAASAVTAAACWLVPEWAQEVRREICRGMIPDKAPGGSAEGALAPVPQEAPAPPASAADPARDAAPRSSQEAAPDAARLASAMRDLRQKLAAWEAIRRPLLAFLSSVQLEGGEEAPLVETADIRSLSSPIGRKLELLCQATEPAEPAEPGLLFGIEPGTLARILVEEGTLDDEDSIRCLESLDDLQRTDCLERLSRLSPRRAAGILRKMLHPGNREERIVSPEASHGKAFEDHGKLTY